MASETTVFVVSHYGAKEALKILTEFEMRGLKAGDKVALEIDPEIISPLEDLHKKGQLQQKLDTLHADLVKLGAQITGGGGKPETNKRFSKQLRTLRELEYIATLVGYLVDKKAVIRGFDIDTQKRNELMESILSRIEAGKKVSRQDRRIERFLKIPVREEMWKPILRKFNPKFVQTGAGHGPAMKSIFSKPTIVDLDPASKRNKIGYRIKGAKVRLEYRAFTLFKKALNKFRRKYA